MSTLLTSMETIVNPTPWLDRPRKAAKLMAYLTTPLGIIALLPSLYGLVFLWPLLLIIPGYSLLIAYWAIAAGKDKRPVSRWNLSIGYNGVLAAFTLYFTVMDLLDQGGNLGSLVLTLAWQLFAIHVSLRGRRADSVETIGKRHPLPSPTVGAPLLLKRSLP